MILVTGGFGFIGSALVRNLVADGHRVLVADDLTNGAKIANLADVPLAHYLDRAELLTLVERDDPELDVVTGVVHLGARTDTTEADGRRVFDLNYRFSRKLLDHCIRRGLPLTYASSAAVYGRSSAFTEVAANEHPLNPYAASKLTFDNVVRERRHARTIGLRFFNVYGPGEEHKGPMASVMRHFHQQATTDGVVRPFGPSHGHAAGQQRRDFVYVDDIVSVIRWTIATWQEPDDVSGIVNVGTGTSRPFQEVADLVLDHVPAARCEYRDFPTELERAYQDHTEADLTALRALGFDGSFRPIEDGVPTYLHWLDEHS